jgi:DNA repair exonuclease SbcCD nuclease subunit
MDFSFLHAADLHLGSPFLGLSSNDEELACRVASASREAFEELVDQAISIQVKFVVIAGDIYDGDWKDTTIGHFFNRQMARLAREGIPVYQVRGNHDAESVITSAVTLPDSVNVFSSRRPETFLIPELKVALHGQSFANRAVPENLALTYPAPEPGMFNIGVLHTSCDGRPPHANYAPCSVQDLLQRGYQYWALGHCHEYEVVNTIPPVIFPGNLQGRSIRETGPKGAVVVEVEDGEVTGFSRVPLARIQWALISADLTGVTSEEEAFHIFQAEIQKEVDKARGTPLVLRMILTGTTPLHKMLRTQKERVKDEVYAAASRCTDEIWLESVKVQTSETSTVPTAHDAPLAAIELKALLDSIRGSPEVLQEARAALAQVKGKLPAMEVPPEIFSDEGIANLLDEAGELLLSFGLSSEERIA